MSEEPHGLGNRNSLIGFTPNVPHRLICIVISIGRGKILSKIGGKSVIPRRPPGDGAGQWMGGGMGREARREGEEMEKEWEETTEEKGTEKYRRKGT